MRRAARGLLALVMGGVVLFTAGAGGSAAPSKRDLREYQKMVEEMCQQHAARRVALALWCMEEGLLDEARQQLEQAAALDAKNKELSDAWGRLVEKTPPTTLVVRMELHDQSRLNGRCSLRPLLLRQKSGILFLRPETLTGLSFAEDVRRETVAAVETTAGTFTGSLTLTSIEVETPLGKFDIPIKKIRSIAFGDKATAPEPAPPDEPTDATPPAGNIESPRSPVDPNVVDLVTRDPHRGCRPSC